MVYFATGLMYIPTVAIDMRSVYFLMASMAIAQFYNPFGWVIHSLRQAYRMTYIYPNIWIRYHILFHLLCIMTKTCILQQIPELYGDS